MKRPSKFEVKCNSLNDQGQGIIKLDKNSYNVNYILPNEEALVSLSNDNKYQKLNLIKLLKTSPNRETPKCGIYEKCGSCQLLHMNYQSQIDFKYNYVINAFKDLRIDFKIDEVIKADKASEYRNKFQVAYRHQDNKITYGFFEEDSHKVIPLNNCIIQTNIQNDIVSYIQNLMTRMRIAPYNEDRRTGIIRFVIIKEAFKTKQLMVVVVTNSDIFPGRNNFVKQLRAKFPEISTIVQNINSRKTSIILGEQERILFGRGYIEDYLLGIKFKISSKTFFQINPEQTEKLYQKVLDFGQFKGNETVIDAYCGVGTIGMVVSKQVKHVIGVESNKQSVINAISNARDNKISNVEFICDDATNFINRIASVNEKIDTVILDPPRSGSTESFLNSVLKLKPKKVIYVSCEAKTLARDLNLLLKEYNISKTAIVDMFVGTYHVETIVLLERK